MTQPVDMDNLNPAEKKLRQCLQAGETCDLGGENSPRPSRPVPDVNVVRAAVIRELIIGKAAVSLPTHALIGMSGAWIEGELEMDFASVANPLYFRNCHFDSQIRMAYAECRALFLDGSCLSQGAMLDSAKMQGSLHMRSGPGGVFTCLDTLSLVGADIGGDLACRGGHFRGGCGDAIAADRARIGGDVVLCGDLENLRHLDVVGDVRFPGAVVKGGVDCSCGLFRARKECALIFVNADIGGNLSCSTSQFHVQDACEMKALGGDRMRVGGDFLMDLGFQAEGLTVFNGARIGGNLNCNNGVFNGGLSAENVRVAGSAFMRKATGQGDAKFTSAKVGTLADDEQLWGTLGVVLDGFEYDRFVGDGVPTDAEARIKWLAKRPDDAPFSPQPYERAAKVLRDMGKSIDAWDIEREKRRLERTERDSDNALKVPLLRRLWGRTIDALTDFVYRPWKTLGWAAPIVLAGALLFNFADENGRMVPHQPVVLAHADYKAETIPPCAEFKCPPERRPTAVVKRLFPDYPEFNALVYSADVFIPFFALHQEPYWYPNPSDSDREILLWILPLWYWLEIGAGWILTSLFLLSVTGVLRPRQSSGEKG